MIDARSAPFAGGPGAALRLARALLLLAALAAPAAASDAGFADGGRAVRSGLATVLVPEARLVPWAERVAPRADRAVRVAAAFWGVDPIPVRFVVDARDDVLNASVDPLPPGGPVVHLRARRPTAGELGHAARDPLGLLLVHEAVHAVGFGGRPGLLPRRLGVVGAGQPWPPPSWLLEGAAVWAEGRLVPGGGDRLDDPDARGVLRLLASEGAWPSLEDASLLTHAGWPAGEVRYLAGGAFVDRLVERHGLPVLRDALRRYEAQAPWFGFDRAWRAAAGTDLHDEWEGLRRGLAAEAAAREGAIRAAAAAGEGPPLLEGRIVGRAPARSPDGRLAWVRGREVLVARLDAPASSDAASARAPSDPTRPARARSGGTTVARARAYPVRVAPDRLAWWGDDRLVWARPVDGPEGRLHELVALDLDSGSERILGRGARAFLPAPLPDGCLAFVRDAPIEGASVRRWCEGDPSEGRTLWAPARPDARVTGLAASPAGRLAAIVTRAGTTRLVELRAEGDGRRAVPLPAPPGALRAPAWVGEEALLVLSDAGGTGESWRVDLRTGRTGRLSATVGGVVGHAPGVVAVRRVGGAALAAAPETPPASEAPEAPPELAAPEGPPALAMPDEAPSEPATAGRPESFGPNAEAVPAQARRDGGTPGSLAFQDAAAPPGDVSATRYRPIENLEILGWLPYASPSGAFGVRVLAEDPTRTVAATARAGLDPTARPGPLGPVVLDVALVRGGGVGPLPVPGRATPFAASLRIGVAPHRAHLAPTATLVPRIDLDLTPRLASEPSVRARLRLAALLLPGDGPRLGATAVLAAADGRTDLWGVPRRGWSASAALRADPVAGGGTSVGAWADAAAWGAGAARPVLAARVGWRPPPVVPAGARGDVAASAAVAARFVLPVEARVADGRWAWERLRVEPGLRLQAAGGEGAARASFGPEARLAADLVAGYGAPFSLGVAAGVQFGDGGGAWLRLEGAGPP